ncbi:MAG: AAA family ATPase [Pseudonocardiaceae bacterium]
MKRLTVIVLSGPIGSGKTTLTEKFSRNYEAKRISTSSLISVAIGQKIDRRELQQVGLGSYFQAGQWISDAVKRIAETSLASGIIVVDAARTREQVIELRKFDSELWRILHVPSDG